MKVHLVDGTYELFRHFFAVPAAMDANGQDVGAVRGVLGTVLSMIERGATHIGVTTDHVVESFRNDLYAGYKTSEGVPPPLLAQFPILETALLSLGVVVWPMVEFEADDALASAAAKAAREPTVDQVVICTPDKDLGQCIVGTRVVQLDRRRGVVRDEAGVVEKFGVVPESIPDYLALVGDSADGFPGVSGWGPKAAALTLSRYAHLEAIPKDWQAAPVNPESADIGLDAVRRLERRPAVSHTGDTAVGCPDLPHGRRAPLDRPGHGLRGLLPPSSVPGPLRPHDIPFGQRSLIDQQMNGSIKSGPRSTSRLPSPPSPFRRFAHSLSVIRHLDKIPIRVAEINRLNRAGRSGSWDGALLYRNPCFLKMYDDRCHRR